MFLSIICVWLLSFFLGKHITLIIRENWHVKLTITCAILSARSTSQSNFLVRRTINQSLEKTNLCFFYMSADRYRVREMGGIKLFHHPKRVILLI
jgi:hypothetical protein